MMKSQYVDMLLKVVQGILADAMDVYTISGGFTKDLVSLTRLSKQRGLGCFQLDLPHLDDLLTRGLRDGRLRLEGALTKRASKSIQVPRLFSGLWLRIFDSDGCLKSDVDPNAIFFLRQLCCVGKKLKVPCSITRLRESVSDYEQIDRGLFKPDLSWDEDVLDSDDIGRDVHFCDIMASHLSVDEPSLFPEIDAIDSGRSSELLLFLQRAADSVSCSLDLFNPLSESCRSRVAKNGGRGFKHGPGAVAHAPGIVDKYNFQHLSHKLLRVFPRIFFYPKGISRETSNHEVPSRLIAVNKTAKSPRLIAAEPVEHQFAQQMLLGWFNYQFKQQFADFISLDNQQLSREMALRGSLDGKLATVDLSAASDRLSCYVIERIFRKRPDILRALHSCRTRWVRNSIAGTRPYYLNLRKYASQGTACTFPVQSLVFLVICMAACGHTDYEVFKRSMRGKVRVYGDDIVIPTNRCTRLYDLLTMCQLKVNTEKSFTSGYFRESCGGDFYRGYDVTPVKVGQYSPTKPEGRQSLLDVSNLFYMKGLWRTAEAVGYLLPDRVRKNLPIVSVTSGSSGLVSFLGSWASHLPIRWNYEWHIPEYKSWGANTKKRTRDRDGTSRLLKFLNEAVAPDKFGDYAEYDSDLLERGGPRDGVAWRALDLDSRFRANRHT
ncbi:MAG: RNA-dependent RNA polymerase [Grapevine-associated levi-like virus 1]|uniref:RNA-directed RNA polymerase n=1 Tax=Grapevine-associated levi-like virus 1 TaxID=2814354 RepID=A0A8F5MLV7_9VIRU|nr:MAG: RNA-dependent RNA polymerase [Grapevine-associated levi-like virus 1]